MKTWPLNSFPVSFPATFHFAVKVVKILLKIHPGDQDNKLCMEMNKVPLSARLLISEVIPLELFPGIGKGLKGPAFLTSERE